MSSSRGSGLDPEQLDTEALAEAFEQLSVATSSLAKALRGPPSGRWFPSRY